MRSIAKIMVRVTDMTRGGQSFGSARAAPPRQNEE